MSYAPVQRFAVTFPSGSTTSSEVNISKSHSRVMVELPSGTTFNLFVQGANSSGGSFKRIYHTVSDGDAAVTAIEITSATAGANGAIVPLPHYAQYMKLETGTAVANGGTWYLICTD